MSMGVSANGEIDEAMRNRAARIALWLPVAAAILYPWALGRFHDVVTFAGAVTPIATAWLALAFALPLSCLGMTLPGWWTIGGTARRLAFAGLAAPPLFVLTGVLTGLLHSPVKEAWIWPAVWIGLGAATAFGKPVPLEPDAPPSPVLRIAHGGIAVLILLFVTFHLFNHLMGVFGPALHTRVMTIGRVVYRSPLVEPVLALLFLLQVFGGALLAKRWSARPLDLPRAIQVGSGAYVGAFVLTHMNSALVAARAVRGVQTDWAWATGAPQGLLLDAWNIRLVPHYALGVVFVVAHLFCGLRQVLLAHGVGQRIADRLWAAGLAGAVALATAITAGLCGLRL